MDQQTPIAKSLHRLCVENPRFLVHPLFWTSEHLRVLHCHFNHLDFAPLPPSLPPSPPLSPSSDVEPDLSEIVQQLLNAPGPRTRFTCIYKLLRHHGLVSTRWQPHFLYNKQRAHSPDCRVFQSSAVHKLQQRPMIGTFQYEELIKQRERALTPKRHPIAGADNLPVERLYQRRMRDLTPALWFEDPYLVCILLSLAQLQWQHRRWTPETLIVRLLVTNVSDTTHAHVFQADIPSKLLHALDHPTHDMDNLVWPAIQHVQVPFEPHASFSERVAGQLLAGLKPRATEEMPRGEKRKRDELDTMGKAKSVKTRDTTNQLAAVPLANG